MIISLIAAHDPNLVIGKDGKLPWRYPEDLKHFKKHTTGQVIIMGRGVFEELGEKPLPNRRNIVLSRTKKYEGIETYTSLEQAIDSLAVDEVFIIGGGVLYSETLSMADRLIITEIKKEYPGDTYFPEYRDRIGKDLKLVSESELEEMKFLEFQRF